MRADLLHVVCVVANPLRWKSRDRLYREFEKHMLESGVRLTTVLCEYGDRPFTLNENPAAVDYVLVRSSSMVWNKENLMNIGISRLPAGWKYVLTCDADVVFRKPGWAAETVHALQHYQVVQPWGECYDLGPDDDHVAVHRSFCKLWQERKPIVQGANAISKYEFGHPGYAWAWTRYALESTGGLLETAALGAGDHHMAMGLIGRAGESIHQGCTQAYKDPIMQWQERAVRHICGRVGHVPGTIEHQWHGSKDARGYVSRWEILVKNAFNPVTDLKKNVFGVWELAGNKPELARDIDAYFRSRNEDSNTIPG